jgi:glycosyltransferase involved in cell wall biosynthesis
MKISYIITTFNRGEKVLKTIGSILKQSRQLDGIEIIVVDGGSRDNTHQLVQELAKLERTVKLVVETAPGVMPSRHVGAKEASGDVLVYIEDDVQVSETHVQTIREIFSHSMNSIATGPCEPDYLSEEFPEWYESLWSSDPSIPNSKINGWFSLMNLGENIISVDASYAWALNFAIRKDLLFELGGFHPDLSPPKWKAYQGDGESGLSYKASERKIKALYHPGLKVLHEIQEDRFDTKYLEKRFFFQGISDSFTKLRKLKEVGSLLKEYSQLFFLNLRFYKKKLFGNKISIDLVCERARLKGYLFHQRSFLYDESVREWVLQETFIGKNVPNPNPIRFFDQIFLMV